MDTALVIKVKYGDFLRRFNVRVDENNQLDLDMIRLRAKILSLFNIPADANFILRYVDEDGDLVTLLDDDDLHDVMRQHLKFLRIDVHMSNDSVGKSNARSNGSSTLLRSPTIPSGNAAIVDALKSVPHPLVKTLPNLSLDFVSKAASSSPVVATLADCVSKMGPSILNSDCQPQVAAIGSSKSRVPEEPVPDQGDPCPFSGTYITDSVAPSFGKENYDLFNFHNKIGNEDDYMKMDHSLSVPSPTSFKSVYENHPMYRKGAILNHARPKLDSCFILDVNVIDGTIMAPSTTFTKIWRMKNNGTIVWPKGTQLVWIGGNMLVDSHSIELEIPEAGIPVDKVFDIAVVLRAPHLPGRYFSYWRMAYPSCQYFGQSISLIIQVEATSKDSFNDGSQGLNLNIPPDDSGYKGFQVPDINVKPIIDEVFLQPHNSTTPTTEPVKQKVDEKLKLQLEKDFPINKSTFNGHSTSSPAPSVAPFSVSEKALVVPSNKQSLGVDVPSSSMVVGGNNSEEETLLEELEEMGFKQVYADKEMLSMMDEYNLEQSVDDLSSSTTWDFIFEEVQPR